MDGKIFKTSGSILALVFLVLALQAVIPAAVMAAPEVNGPELSPVQKEIRDLMAGEKAELDTLNAQFSKAVSQAVSLDLQMQIQEIKMNTRIAMFQIQLKYARERGDLEQVTQIEGILQTLKVGGSHGEPVVRESNGLGQDQ